MSKAIKTPVNNECDYEKWYYTAEQKVSDAEVTTTGLSVMLDAFIYNNGLDKYYKPSNADSVPEVWNKLVDTLAFVQRSLLDCSERLKSV